MVPPPLGDVPPGTCMYVCEEVFVARTITNYFLGGTPEWHLCFLLLLDLDVFAFFHTHREELR
jgi:hypothetical protein